MQKESHYKVLTKWSGIEGTRNNSYDRTHIVSNGSKPDLVLTTANPARGDANKLNPEDLLIAAVSSCHMLSYLYLCAAEGVIITEYTDNAIGTLTEVNPDDSFISGVELNPVVTVASEDMVERAISLHHKAHDICIIAKSVRFEVKNNPVCKVK